RRLYGFQFPTMIRILKEPLLNFIPVIYLVTGAGSGFGRAISERLASEGHQILAVSRSAEPLEALRAQFPDAVETFVCDLTQAEEVSQLAGQLGTRTIDGMLLNAGGPPTMNSLEASADDWNKAWNLVFMWKAELCR